MKATALAALVLLCGCDKIKAEMGVGDASAAPAAQIVGDMFGADFEGEITSKMQAAATPTKSQVIVFGIKKPKYRMDMTEASPGAAQPPLGSMIVDLPTKKGWMLIHPQKIAMPLDLAHPMANPMQGLPGAPKGVPTQAPSTPPAIEKTGKKDVVAGYTCEIWNITSDGRKAETCMAENLTWIDMTDLGGMGGGLSGAEVALGAAMSGGNHFPLRVITHDKTGKEEMRLEAQKIEKKKLDDARFVPPPDYKQLAIPTLPPNLQIPGKR